MRTPEHFEGLHVGKLTEEAKFTLTPQMHDLIADRARSARCNPSDLYRDAIFLAVTGATYADHVANDRRAALSREGQQQGDKGADE
jgi:hypothetical protein